MRPSSNLPDSNTNASSSHRWLVVLAALVPVGVSLLALGLRARRPSVDSYEAWWQARADARANGIPLPSPSPNRHAWFI
jgi:hypothetical protein